MKRNIHQLSVNKSLILEEAKELQKLSKEEIQTKKDKFGKMAKGLKKGNFTSYCQSHGYTTGSHPDCIAKALKEADDTGNSTLKRRAVLARTFAGMAKKRKENNAAKLNNSVASSYS